MISQADILKRLEQAGLQTTYILSMVADKSNEELRNMRDEKGNLTKEAQQELSLRGNSFVQLDRFMLFSSDEEIEMLLKRVKRVQYTFNSNDSVYCDFEIIKHYTMLMKCIRSDKDYSLQIANEIARDLIFWQNKAREFSVNCEKVMETMNNLDQFITDFAKELISINLSLTEFIKETGTPRKTAEHWYYGTRRVPQIVFAWIKLWKKVNGVNNE